MMSRSWILSIFDADGMRHWLGERERRVLHTSAWSMAVRIAGAVNLFLAVPFVLKSLGPVQFGAWATLISFITFTGFLDFGLGNGAMNLIAAAHGSGRTEEIGKIYHESVRTLLVVAAALAIVSSIIVPLVPWHRLLRVPLTMAFECRMAVASVLFTIVMAVPLNLANRVLLGLGQGHRAFRWQVLGQLLTVGVVITLSKTAATLATLTAAAAATPLLTSIANTVMLRRGIITGHHHHRSKDRTIALKVRREGFLFFVLQLAAALAFSADLSLISALRGPIEAGNFAIVQRYFSVVTLGLSMIWAPLWPIYRQALAAADFHWAIKTLRRSLLLAVIVATGISLFLYFAFHLLLKIWIRQPVQVSNLLLAGFVVWTIIEAIGTAFSTFLNAASIIRYQIIAASLFAALCFTAKFWSIHRFGMVSVPWITALVYAVANILPTLILWPRLIKATLTQTY